MANEDQKKAERIQLAAVSPSAGGTRRLKKISGVEGGMAESITRLELSVVSKIFGSITLQADALSAPCPQGRRSTAPVRAAADV